MAGSSPCDKSTTLHDVPLGFGPDRKPEAHSSFTSFTTYRPDCEQPRDNSSSERPASSSVRAVLYILRVFILIGSISVVGFSARGLQLYARSQRATLLAGANGIQAAAWPENLNLAPAKLLLATGALSLAFSAAVLALQFVSAWRKTERWVHVAWLAGVVGASLSLLFWFIAIVVFETVGAKKDQPTLSLWACERRMGMADTVVDYQTVCNTQTTSAMTAVVLCTFEGLILLSFGGIAFMQRKGSQTAQDLKVQVVV